MMRFIPSRQGLLILLSLAVCWSFSKPVAAIDIVLDYSYDTNDFFGAGNPDEQGAAAKAAIEDAAAFFSNLLDDTFSSIETPPDYHSSVSTGIVYWSWSQIFTHPGTGAGVVLDDDPIAEDEYRMYVGARSLAGTTLGQGGPGGRGLSLTNNGGFFGSGESDEIDLITTEFFDAVDTRGEPSGFTAWGGAATFDNDASTTWHYDHTTATPSGKSDFYSVVLHEFGHSLGLNGSVDEWNAWQVGAEYRGPASLAAWIAEDPTASPAATGIPTVSSGNHHWKDNSTTFPYDPMVSSYIVGTTTLQETAMDPSLTQGERKLFTNVDALALQDIGWEVTLPAILGDMNGDGSLTDADINLFVQALVDRTGYDALGFEIDADVIGDIDGSGLLNLGDVAAFKALFSGAGSATGSAVPEPTTMLLVLSSLLGFVATRRRAK